MNGRVRTSRERLIEAKVPGCETGIEVKKSICSVCGIQCGVDAYVRDGRLIKVEGTAENPGNHGTLCAKGAANRQWVYNKERLRTPLMQKGEKGSGDFVPLSWDEALDRIAENLNRARAESGPESVVFFTGYPKWLRPFLKRLAHSFGSPNYCTESSTCFLATVLANRLTYGCSAAPDLKGTKCILNWSSNPHYSAPPTVGRLLQAAEQGVKIIDVGPLSTPLSSRADVHLRLRPGTSGALALGMAHVIIEEGLYDRDFVDNWTVGFDEYRDYAAQFPPEVTSRITGVPTEKIIAAAKLYGGSKPAAMLNSASITVHHTNGVQNHRAITALIGLTGNFDRPGGSHLVRTSYYHRPTGLENREEEFEQPRQWSAMAPRIGEDRFPVWCQLIPEAQATQLPFQIATGTPYPLRAMLGFGVNHRMWPGSSRMGEALTKLDFFVDMDLFMTDTARLADIVLPACSSLERSELTIQASRFASWTEPVIPPVGQSRSDVDVIIELSRRLGLDDQLLEEGHEACLDWMFEPSAVRVADVRKSPGGGLLADRTEVPYEKYREHGFPTPSGKMEFTSQVLKDAGFDALPTFMEPLLSPTSAPDVAKQFPLVLTTGARLPMFMHSRMYRIPWLRRLRPDPMADVNPEDARVRGIEANQWIALRTPGGEIRVRANLTELVPPGVVNMYHGFPGADANDLIDQDYRDPISGYPGYKSLLCDIEKLQNEEGRS